MLKKSIKAIFKEKGIFRLAGRRLKAAEEKGHCEPHFFWGGRSLQSVFSLGKRPLSGRTFLDRRMESRMEKSQPTPESMEKKEGRKTFSIQFLFGLLVCLMATKIFHFFEGWTNTLRNRKIKEMLLKTKVELGLQKFNF